MSQYQEVWRESLSSKVKLTNYMNITNKVSCAKHISSRLFKGKRALISRVRCGILPIKIETDRKSRLRREDRICPLCNFETEDELHFLFRCPALLRIRTKHYHKFPEILILADLYKFGYLCDKPYLFGKYICLTSLTRAKCGTR